MPIPGSEPHAARAGASAYHELEFAQGGQVLVAPSANDRM